MIKRAKFYFKTTGFSGLQKVIRAKFTKSILPLKMNTSNCRHTFCLRLPSSDVQTYKQVFIDQEYDCMTKTPPKVIIDAGANIGLTSIYFANKYPDAKIIAIEPEQSNYDLLEENIALYPNIIPVHAALWNKNEIINLIDPGLGKWGFMTELKNSSENQRAKTCHDVMAITVDNIIQEHNLSKIDILKIDIEGAEREVFFDTSSWIDKVDSIIIELHERMKTGCNRSFYNGSSGFDNEWSQGDSIFLSRRNYLSKRTI